MKGFVVHRLEAGEFTSNSYICYSRKRNISFLVDPGMDWKPINDAFEELDIKPSCVFCTHGHFDHIGTASFFQKRFSIPVYLHAADLKLAKAANFLLMAMGLKGRLVLPIFTLVSAEKLTYDVGGLPLHYHPIPGHSPGSCILEFGDFLFTGDSMYSRGLGLSKLPGENAEQLRASLQRFWGKIRSECHIYPGHGAHAPFDEIREKNSALLSFLSEVSDFHEEIKDV